MGDMTLDDLVSSSGNSSSSSGNSDNGQWVLDLVERLDDKGYLEAMIFGNQRDMDEIQAERKGQTTDQNETEQQATEQPSEGVQELDAESLKSVMLEVYDHTSMVPGLDDDPTLSDLIKLVDSNPEMVDQLIDQHL